MLRKRKIFLKKKRTQASEAMEQRIQSLMMSRIEARSDTNSVLEPDWRCSYPDSQMRLGILLGHVEQNTWCRGLPIRFSNGLKETYDGRSLVSAGSIQHTNQGCSFFMTRGKYNE